MSETKGKKGSLPHGWVVKRSSTYKDRVYYFNVHTRVSTWTLPELDESKESKKKCEKKEDVKKGKGLGEEEKPDGNSSKSTEKDSDGKKKTAGKEKANEKDLDRSEESLRPKQNAVEEEESRSKGNDKKEENESSLEEGELVDSEKEGPKETAKTGKETDANITATKDSSGKRSSLAVKQDSEKPHGSESESPRKRRRHSRRRRKKKKKSSDSEGESDHSRHLQKRKSGDRKQSDSESDSDSKSSKHSRSRLKNVVKGDCVVKDRSSCMSCDKVKGSKKCDRVDDRNTSEMRLPNARQLGLKPPILNKPLRRPQTCRVSTAGPVLVPSKKASKCTDRGKGTDVASVGKKVAVKSQNVDQTKAKRDSLTPNVSKTKGIGATDRLKGNSGQGDKSVKGCDLLKCTADKPNKREVLQPEIPKPKSPVKQVGAQVKKIAKESLKRNICDDKSRDKSENSGAKCAKISPKDNTPQSGTVVLTKNQRKKRARVARRKAALAAEVKVAGTQIQNVMDTPEERRKLEALRRSQVENLTTTEKQNVIGQSRPIRKAVRRLQTPQQGVETNLGKTGPVAASEGPLGAILDFMNQTSADSTKDVKPARTVHQKRPTGSKLVKPKPPSSIIDSKVSFTIVPTPKAEFQQIDFDALNKQHDSNLVTANCLGEGFGRPNPDALNDEELSPYADEEELTVPNPAETTPELHGKLAADANYMYRPDSSAFNFPGAYSHSQLSGDQVSPYSGKNDLTVPSSAAETTPGLLGKPALGTHNKIASSEFSFLGAYTRNQHASEHVKPEQQIVHDRAMEVINKSGGLFGKGGPKNLFGKSVIGAGDKQVSSVGGASDKHQCSRGLDLGQKRFSAATCTSTLSSPEAMQEEISFMPEYRPVTPELPSDLSQSWQNMDTMVYQSHSFHTPIGSGLTRSALSEPLPQRSVLSVSPFEAALGIGNKTLPADEIESMDIDQSNDNMTPVSSRIQGRLTKAPFRGLSDAHNQKLFIVLDTNVLMDHTEYIEDLRDRTFSNLGKPMIIVPWVVMQELDSLKDNKRKDQRTSFAAESQARSAVKFLHTCFQMRHPRLVGQTPQEASLATSSELKIETNDDRILQCCVLCIDLYPESLVVLFTNDLNLCNKAIIMGIQAFTYENLHNGINNFCEVSADVDHGVPHDYRPHTPDLDPAQKKIEDIKKLADDVFCELKDILHEGLSIVLGSEMWAVYEDAWEDIVFKKPPWTLNDILHSINKHWIAVFGNVFGRDLEFHVNALSKNLKSGLGLKELCGCIYNGIALYETAQKSKSHSVPQTFEKCLRNLHVLRKVCQGILMEKLPTDLSLDDLKEKVCSPADTAKTDASRGQELQSLDSVTVEGAVSRSASPDVLMHPSQQTSPEVFVLRKKDFDAVQHKFQSLWENISRFCNLLVQVFKAPKGTSLGPGLPSRDESVTFFAKLLPCIEDLQSSYLKMIMLPPELLESRPEVFLHLCEHINSFFCKLDIQITSDPLEARQLKSFFADNEKREVLKNGYTQLEEMIRILQFCDAQLGAEERLVVHGAN